MNLGTLKLRLSNKYMAGVAAALAVAAIACLWLLPSTREQQLGEARRLLDTGKQAFNANDGSNYPSTTDGQTKKINMNK